MDRRYFLKGVGATSLLPLGGCCITSPSIEGSAIYQPFASGDEVNTILAPAFINSQNKMVSRIIDPHVHIYNATDWQIAGGMRGPLAHSAPSQLITNMLMVLATPVEQITKRVSLSAYGEYQLLSQWEALAANDAADAMDNYMEQHLQSIADELADVLAGTLVENAINVLLTINLGDVSAQGIPPTFGADFIYAIFTYEGDTADFQGTGLDLVIGLFVFLRHITSPRFDNLRQYQKNFSMKDNLPGVDGCYASYLDFDYWIGDCPHAVSGLDDQVILMDRISRLSNGYMKPVVPYNPWTDINDDDEAINRVVRAVTEFNHIGVKIYPHLGYFPSGNNPGNYPADGDPHPDFGLLNEKLAHFFSVCRSLGVPVMAHSEESMGRLPSHNQMGSPDAWEAFFNIPENAGTKINLAHIGGEKGGGTGTGGWTGDFVDRMKHPGAAWLYGDFGLWDDLVFGSDESVQRIVSLLDVVVSNNETAADRFMFGSDWFMLTFTFPHTTYASVFQQRLLDAGVPLAILEKLFHENAERLYGQAES